MTKHQILKLINDRIDRLIIADRIKTTEYVRLVKLHQHLTH